MTKFLLLQSGFDPRIATSIVILYMIGVLGIGIFVSRIRPSRNLEDYLLAGRSMNWFVGFFSLAASQISALAFVGFIAFYYNIGLAAYIGIMGFNTILFGAVYAVLAPRIWKLGRHFGYITPSDALRAYYDSSTLGYIIGLGMILALIPYLEIQFLGVGILLKLTTGGQIPVTIGAATIAAVIAIYVWLGGMESVAWVDTVQGVLLLSGTFIGGLFLVFTVGEGFGPAFDRIGAELPGLLSVPGRTGSWGWPFIMSFGLSVFLGWLFHPHMWLRTQYFENGRAVYNISWMWVITILLTQIGGFGAVLAGVLVIPNAPPDQFILLMYRQYFSTAIFGLISAAALAAMMSSASSQCHGVGAVVSRDIVQQLKPEWGDRHYVLSARSATLIAIILAFTLSTFELPFLLTTGAASGALSASLVFPQAVTAIMGWRWPTRTAATAASLCGGTTTLAILAAPWISSPAGIYGGFWGLSVNIILFVGVSLVTDDRPDSATIDDWSDAKQTTTTELGKD